MQKITNKAAETGAICILTSDVILLLQKNGNKKQNTEEPLHQLQCLLELH